jgi:hypothetical protein
MQQVLAGFLVLSVANPAEGQRQEGDHWDGDMSRFHGGLILYAEKSNFGFEWEKVPGLVKFSWNSVSDASGTFV